LGGGIKDTDIASFSLAQKPHHASTMSLPTYYSPQKTFNGATQGGRRSRPMTAH